MQAILGGTFDPVHRGHLHAASVGRALLNAPAATLMLAARPRHPAAPATSVAHRLRMLRLAVATVPGLAASDREARRDGPSYAVDTLAALLDGEPLVWLIGADAFAAVASWHRAEDLPTLCHFLVFDRPGAVIDNRTPPGFRTVRDAAELGQRPSGCVLFAHAPMLDVSATRIRRDIAMRGGGTVGDGTGSGVAEYDAVGALLTPEVRDYIRLHGLYGRGAPRCLTRRR